MILAVNGGSSSLKCALFEVQGESLRSLSNLNLQNESGGTDGLVACLETALQKLRQDHGQDQLAAVGHRVVHGGDRFARPAVVDADVMAGLQELVELAPLHQPANLALIENCHARLPAVPQVACFDTAFHSDMPDVARNYALPRSLTEAGIHGYGFHGLSYEYVWETLQQLDAGAVDKRIIVAHFGAGASLCAIRTGSCIATTMGFSTVTGMPMATRSGSVDPGVLIHLMRTNDMSADELENLLYKESGLLAISGISGDMRELAASPDPRAKQAIDYFVYRAAREIGSLCAALGGLDTLVFTGGIGANDAAIRQDVCTACDWLGVSIDSTANEKNEKLISAGASDVEVRAITTNEEMQIARHVQRLLNTTRGNA
jgi:acetate kinase